jgi:hypothetical protein
MKVGFVGAQSCGKSTQAELLKENCEYHLVKSASRTIAELGVPVNREASLAGQIMIAGQQETDMIRCRDYKNLVMERTHVDSLAYAVECDLSGVYVPYYYCVSQLARKQMNEYFNIVLWFPAYLPETFEDTNNNRYRDPDVNYRAIISSRIEGLLATLSVKYHTVPQDTVENVHNWIKETIL